jgi:phosphoribosylformimino-5-aminoimidazole carboxamide ribotide isomerase
MIDLFPAIDLREGRAVRLTQGDFSRQHDYGDPLALALRFQEGGAKWLHVVDLDAARTGEPTNRAVVVAIAEAVGMAVQTGGGVRTEGDVGELLAAGLARVVLGTAALEDPALALRCAERFPGQVALGLDYRRRADGQLEAAVRGWAQGSGQSVAGALASVAEAPLGAVVVTAIERDGTLSGPDLEGLGEVLDATALPVIASGGVGGLADLRALGALVGAGGGRALVGAVVGKALVDGRISVEEAVATCAASG